MKDMIKRIGLAASLCLAMGVLYLAHAAPVVARAASGLKQCDCNEYTFDPPCSGEVDPGTFECDGGGSGFVCDDGEWVQCYEWDWPFGVGEDYDYAAGNNGDLDPSCDVATEYLSDDMSSCGYWVAIQY